MCVAFTKGELESMINFEMELDKLIVLKIRDSVGFGTGLPPDLSMRLTRWSIYELADCGYFIGNPRN